MTRLIQRLAVLLTFVLLGVAPSAHAQIILADSVTEFSGIQGQNNWFYGYYATSGVSSSFTQFTIFDINDWKESNTFPPFTNLNAIGGHPGGSNSSPGIEHWAVRRYISEKNGGLILQGDIAKNDLDSPTSSGTVGRIYHNGLEIYSQTIAGGDGIGVHYLVRLNEVALGDHIDFAIDPNGDDYFDGTRFTARVTAPAPSSLLIGCVGVLPLLILRRRRR
ncbi:MAG: hypothetical protein H7308_02305 [Chthonomonadaceae bacterium]|nr:hypothetical protein [Chthonomonadaceae bacterium]